MESLGVSALLGARCPKGPMAVGEPLEALLDVQQFVDSIRDAQSLPRAMSQEGSGLGPSAFPWASFPL